MLHCCAAGRRCGSATFGLGLGEVWSQSTEEDGEALKKTSSVSGQAGLLESGSEVMIPDEPKTYNLKF
jgi:hypothetical protein